MPIPLLVAGAVGLGIGLPTGWKFGRWFFGEEVEPLPKSGEREAAYNLQITLLQYSLHDNFLDKKIYGYYLFSLIFAQQRILQKLKIQIESNGYIEYIKNTLPEWEQAINDIKIQLDATLVRYLCYESLMKRIYNISYEEKDIEKISEKIVPFDYLSELQITQLITWIINPLFNGWYDFETKDIPVISCPEIKIYDSCKKFIVKVFPSPDTMKDPKDHNSGPLDVIMPLVIEQAIILKKSLGKELIDEWFGFIDVGIQQFTGIKAGYVIKGGKAVDELAGTAADFYDNMRKEFRSFRNSLSNAYSNTAAGLSGFAEAITIAGIGAAALVAYNLFQSNTSNNNS